MIWSNIDKNSQIPLFAVLIANLYLVITCSNEDYN